MDNKVIKFKTVHLDEKGTGILRFFFKKYFSERCEVLSGPDKDADAFIINMDHHKAESERVYLQKSYPETSIILTALNPIESEGNYFLRKPIIADKLLDIIKEIEKDHASRVILTQEPRLEVEEAPNSDMGLSDSQHASSGHAADLLLEKGKVEFSENTANINFPEQRDVLTSKFNLDDYFLGAIFQAYKLAIESQSVVKLSGLWRPICFFPDTNEIYIDLSNSQLRSVCASSIMNQASTVTPREIKIEKSRREWELSACHKSNRFRSIESFMWKVALYTSRGRVPDFVDIEQAVPIVSWPNLTRLDLTPDALKLIAYWSSSPRSLQNSIDTLGVEQRYVFSLYTAMYVLGHVVMGADSEKEYDITTKVSTPLPEKTKGLLSRVVTKLKFAW
ncbi:MAG: hypothetical protein GQ475_05100 [Methylococcaceae bacterium]|nr:hypothetical protein [Methylococcaceae bacterium]